MSAVLTVIASWFTKLLTWRTAQFVALRILLFSLLTVVLPLVLHNVFWWIFGEIANYFKQAAGANPQGLSAVTIQLTGLAAWMGAKLKLPESLGLILSAASVRLTYSTLLPFFQSYSPITKVNA